jgi:hypothetical protein
MLLAGDGDDDLIQVPLVAALGGTPTNAVGELAAKFQTPLPDRLIGHRDAASRQYLFDHAKAEWKPKVQPDRVADDLSRVSIAGINRIAKRRHPAHLPDQPGSTKPALGQLDGAVITRFTGLPTDHFSERSIVNAGCSYSLPQIVQVFSI